MDDEDAFKKEVREAAWQSDHVNYLGHVESDDDSWIIVELFTGDRFKVSIEQVRED